MTWSEAFERAWRPHDRRPIHEWAPDCVELFPPISKPGRISLAESRHFIGPLEAIWDDGVRQVNICAPTRSGKTLIVELAVHSKIVRQPGPILWSFQDEEAAQDEAEDRLWPQFQGNRLVAPLLPSGQWSKTKKVEFPRMILQIVGPADSNFQSRGWQWVILDEVWLYKRGKVEEARGRLGDFEKLGTDKFILLSQGGDIGSDWDTEFNKGLIHEWCVQCQACGHYMAPKFRAHRPDGSRWGFMFDSHKNDRGLLIESRVVPTVRFECEKCAHPHIWSARTKSEWNRTGKYFEEANSEKRRIRRSHHWNSIIDTPWETLCALYIAGLNALKLGNPIPLIKFLQKSGAEMAGETTILEGGQSFSRIELKSDKWDEAEVRLMAVDKQQEFYWVEVRDFSSKLMGESRRVWFGKLYSYAEIEAKRIELKVTELQCGPAVFIDSGFDAKGPNGVYAACARYGWTAVKGVGTVTGERKPEFRHRLRGDGGNPVIVRRSYSELIAADPEIGTTRQGASMARLIRFCSDTMADLLDSMIERGMYKEPIVDDSDPLEVERKRHFRGEYKKEKIDKFSGRRTMVRVCPTGENHSYDLGKIFMFGAVVTEMIPDPLDETGVKI